MTSKPALLGGDPVRKRPFTRWPLFDHHERTQLEDVLTSASWGGFPSPNRKASELSSRFADFQGVRYAIPTSSGTTALEVALKALGIGPGDEVIVPAITFAATAYAPVAALARPVFADIDPATVCISARSVERLVTSRTKAIIPVHYGAAIADLDELIKVAQRHGLAIVEDCAHVPGAQWRDRGVGGWGEIGCFSFQTTKPMTAGEGGMVVTNDPELEQRCQSLINCGRRRPTDTFETPLLGANYRMSEWQCGVLLAQLLRMPEQIERKSAQAARLRERLNAIDGITAIPRDPRITREVIYMVLFRVDEARMGLSRNRFVRALRSEGIPCGVGNEPVYRSALFPAESVPYRTACTMAGVSHPSAPDCLDAERMFEHELVSLPHELLLGGDADTDDIAAAVEKIAASARELSAAKLDRAR